MITVDVYRNVKDSEPFEIESFTASSKEEAKKIFKRELQNLALTVKHPKFSDQGSLVQVRTNRGRIIGEIEVSI